MKKIITSILLLGSFSVWSQCSDTNLGAWSENVTNGGEVTVSANSAMGGTDCGLEVVYLEGAGKGYVGDTNAANEQRIRGAVCLDPNSIVLPLDGVGGKIKFLNGQCTNGTCANNGIMQWKLQSDGVSAYEINGYVRDSNSGGTKKKFTVALSDAPHRLEYDMDITTGTFKMWVDATSEADPRVVEFSGLDMAAWNGGVSRSRIGSLNNPINVTPGVDKVIYLDEAEWRRQTFIGGSCN